MNGIVVDSGGGDCNTACPCAAAGQISWLTCGCCQQQREEATIRKTQKKDRAVRIGRCQSLSDCLCAWFDSVQTVLSHGTKFVVAGCVGRQTDEPERVLFFVLASSGMSLPFTVYWRSVVVTTTGENQQHGNSNDHRQTRSASPSRRTNTVHLFTPFPPLWIPCLFDPTSPNTDSPWCVYATTHEPHRVVVVKDCDGLYRGME